MINIKRHIILSLAVAAVCASCNNHVVNSEKIKHQQPTEYTWVKSWPQLPKGYMMGQVTGVGVDTSQNVILFCRAGRLWTEPFPDSTISANTVLTLDRETGRVLKSWGAHMFIMPHGLTVDKENNIWLTDVALQQVFKFSHDGRLLMTLGVAKTAGDDSLHFNLPTDVAVADDGSFYVSDGYGNSRVVKFSKEGKYVLAWGKKGNQEGEFNTPHGIDLDAAGNVYIADRNNNRIQEFDANGNFLKEWKNDSGNQLYSLTVNKMSRQLMAIDYAYDNAQIYGSDILQFNPALSIIKRFGRTEAYQGPVCRYHDIAMDKQGNIYVGDILNGCIQKFEKVSN